MRDINRIDGYCARFAELWKRQPDMRFGQLMCNMLNEVDAATNRDPFFIEDDDFMKLLEKINWLQK